MEKKMEIVMEKIKKLLRLSESPNEAEASLAIEKAQNLLREYNLSMQDIEKDKNSEIKKEDLFELKREPTWKSLIISGVCQAYYCKSFLYKKRLNLKDYVYVRNIIGKEHNVIVAIEVIKYLFSAVERLAKEYKGKNKLDYKKGLACRIADRLKELNKQDREYCNALVVSEEGFLNKYLKENFNVTTRYSNVRINHNEAYSRGYKDGNNVSLNTQIHGKQKLGFYLS